ncbi:hypothetical protein AGOR_G00114020 [Albula goreensis]|uniref:Uncharacterized protein n=1 Tax=Albula goreensis TaxID=1534307 RepID=A0A8T3DEU3_9TELE|nr:hypothetical protein AGOR_G00114020 [Albula goreensis]
MCTIWVRPERCGSAVLAMRLHSVSLTVTSYWNGKRIPLDVDQSNGFQLERTLKNQNMRTMGALKFSSLGLVCVCITEAWDTVFENRSSTWRSPHTLFLMDAPARIARPWFHLTCRHAHLIWHGSLINQSPAPNEPRTLLRAAPARPGVLEDRRPPSFPLVKNRRRASKNRCENGPVSMTARATGKRKALPWTASGSVHRQV